jgi:hypothetical protein
MEVQGLPRNIFDSKHKAICSLGREKVLRPYDAGMRR